MKKKQSLKSLSSFWNFCYFTWTYIAYLMWQSILCPLQLQIHLILLCHKVLSMGRLPRITDIVNGRAENQTWAVWPQALCAQTLHCTTCFWKASKQKRSLLQKITNIGSLLSNTQVLHIIPSYLLCLATTFCLFFFVWKDSMAFPVESTVVGLW